MSFVGLYTGLSGIRAAQAGIDTSANNIANASTTGYTRQRVELRPSHTFQSPAGPVGTGVTVDSIARLRDGFLDDRFRSAIGAGAEHGARAEFLMSMETLSGEPDQGLAVAINRLWPAAEAWSNDPADPATRRAVLTELGAIAEQFNATAAAWDSLRIDTSDRRATAVDTANQLLEQVHQLNLLMANAPPGTIGPERFDQRDVLIDQLAELTGATARPQADGSVVVRLGDTVLVGADQTNGLTFAAPPAVFSIAAGADGAPGRIEVTRAGVDDGQPRDLTAGTSGEIGGLHRALEIDLPEWQGHLDDLAVRLSTAINEINQAGRTADGAPGFALFTGDGAASLRIAPGITTASLAAAGAGADPVQPHDATNARALADLRTVRFPDESGRTLEGQLADLVVGLGGRVRSARTSAEASIGVATGAGLARAAEHGVSIDEEMVGLVRYQRALEAAARVMTTVDEALEVLMRVGIVGR